MDTCAHACMHACICSFSTRGIMHRSLSSSNLSSSGIPARGALVQACRRRIDASTSDTLAACEARCELGRHVPLHAHGACCVFHGRVDGGFVLGFCPLLPFSSFSVKQKESGEELKSERENGEAETDAAVGGRVGGKIKFGVSS